MIRIGTSLIWKARPFQGCSAHTRVVMLGPPDGHTAPAQAQQFSFFANRLAELEHSLELSLSQVRRSDRIGRSALPNPREITAAELIECDQPDGLAAPIPQVGQSVSDCPALGRPKTEPISVARGITIGLWKTSVEPSVRAANIELTWRQLCKLM
jgi:hypothetical protein